ncbi:MAG TPA: PEGA domain-containing protein [Myxococcota bacterium]|nr:PEGA domain-containing protein [Myxococcota bacterium]
MNRTYISFSPAVILLTFFLQAAWGATGKPGAIKVALLPVETEGLDKDWGGSILEIMAAEIRAMELFDLAPAAETKSEMAEMKKNKLFTKNCLYETTCIRLVGKKLAVAAFYHLHAAKTLDGITLTMRVLDGNTGKEIRKASDFAGSDPKDLERAVRWLTRTVSSPLITSLASEKGELHIRCGLPDAEVFINGKRFGKTTGKNFKVSAGAFDLVVQKKGYEPFHDVIVVKSGEEKLVVADLVPLPGTIVKKPVQVGSAGVKKPFLPGGKKPGGPEPGESTKFYKAWWFWTLVGVVVAGAGGTAAYFLLRSSGPSGQGAVEASWR